MHKRTKMISLVLVSASAAATLSLAAWLNPTAETMTPARLDAESALLAEASQDLPWWMGWVTALRHETISDEWSRRYAERAKNNTDGLLIAAP